MICPNCSTANEDSFRFCRECGRSLAAATEPAAPAPVSPPPGAAARRRAGIAIGAGVLTVAASAVGLSLARGKRAAPRKPPAAAVSRPSVGLPPATGTPLRPGPAPSQLATGSPAMTSALAFRPPKPFVGPPIPPALAARRREGENGGLSPAAVRRVEPGAPSITIEPSAPAGTPPGPIEARGGSAPSQKPERQAADPAGDPSINIQVLGGGTAPAPEARPVERPQPARLDISVQPAEFAPLREAREQLQAGRRLQGQGRSSQAREAYAAAERLFRFAVQRGGSEAAAARQGLAEAQRALRSAQAVRDGSGEE
jgi:hypothetical protein